MPVAGSKAEVTAAPSTERTTVVEFTPVPEPESLIVAASCGLLSLVIVPLAGERFENSGAPLSIVNCHCTATVEFPALSPAITATVWTPPARFA